MLSFRLFTDELSALGLEPLLDLRLRAGEGVGAALGGAPSAHRRDSASEVVRTS